MIKQKIRVGFAEDGMCLWKNFIPRKKAVELRNLVMDIADYERKIGKAYIYAPDHLGRTQRVWNLTNKSNEFRSLLEMDHLNATLNFIFERKTKHHLFHLSSFQANIIYPGAQRQKLHIDTPFPEPLPPWPAKANSIWMLDEFTESNGATEFIRGSQKNSVKPNNHSDQDLPVEKAMGKMGTVLFTHGNLWHRAEANNGRHPRVGLLCSFAASYMREIASEEDQSSIISDDVKEQLSENLRAILGVGHGLKEDSDIRRHVENT